MTSTFWVLLILLTPVIVWADESVEIGESAISFELPSVTWGDEIKAGPKVALDDFKGKVVYLDFWATWCGPCKLSLPWLNKLQDEVDSDKVAIVAVTIDKKFDKVKRFIRSRQLDSLTILSNPDGKVAESYNLPSFPTSFLIDQSGKIRKIYKGFREDDKQEIEQDIQALL